MKHDTDTDFYQICGFTHKPDKFCYYCTFIPVEEFKALLEANGIKIIDRNVVKLVS